VSTIRRVRTGFAWLALTLFAAFCSLPIAEAQTVSYNFADAVNFTVFKTYDWVVVEGAEAADSSLDVQIRKAIETQLEKKGLTRSVNAQLLIAYQVSIRRERQIMEYNPRGSPWEDGPGWRQDQDYGYNHGYNFVSAPLMSTATGFPIPIGNLVLDIYDAAYKELIWRGEVSKALRFVDDAERRRQQLHKAVAKLFEPYPPKRRNVRVSAWK
jgi:hypothetical protein